MGRKNKIDLVLDKADPVELIKLFKDTKTRLVIEKRLKMGKYSLLDLVFSKAFDGDTKVLLEVFKKLYPDKKPEIEEGVVGNIEIAWKDSNVPKIIQPKIKKGL